MRITGKGKIEFHEGGDRPMLNYNALELIGLAALELPAEPTRARRRIQRELEARTSSPRSSWNALECMGLATLELRRQPASVRRRQARAFATYVPAPIVISREHDAGRTSRPRGRWPLPTKSIAALIQQVRASPHPSPARGASFDTVATIEERADLLLDRLMQIVQAGSDADALRAIETILSWDRKPKEAVEPQKPGQAMLEDLRKLSHEEMLELRRELGVGRRAGRLGAGSIDPANP
jgi:hypothetical protein